MACLIAFVTIGAADAATLVGGDYAGADLVPAEGDALEGTFINVGTFHVAPGVHVRAKNGVPLVVEADTILIEGHLDGNGAGFNGGRALAQGRGPGAPDRGRGGGGYGGAGGRTGANGSNGCDGPPGNPVGGDSYGSHDDPLLAPRGSGGGGGQCGQDDVFPFDLTFGGDGGGSITLRADTISVGAGGGVSVNGAQAQDVEFQTFCDPSYDGAGSGGGSGGSLVLDATVSVQIEGALTARGGRGGQANDSYVQDSGGGGGGGGGRIKIYGPIAGAVARPDVEGGHGGHPDPDSRRLPCMTGDDGGRGTIYVDDWVAGPPAIAVGGVCGAVTLTVSDGTPYGNVDLIVGTAAGTDPLPGGICAGIVTGLTVPSKLVTRALDENGSLTLSGVGPDCGIPLQVIDLWSCTTSPVVTLP